MTVAELETEVAKREAEGRDRMILAFARKRSPRSYRVRVLPGVLGIMVGFDDGSVVADVAVADLRRYLARIPSVWSGNSVAVQGAP